MFAPRNLHRFMRRVVTTTVAPTRPYVRPSALFAVAPSDVEGRGRSGNTGTRRIRLRRPLPTPTIAEEEEEEGEGEGAEVEDDAALNDGESIDADVRPQYAMPEIDEATNEFSRLGLTADLVRGLASQGFATPTPVQARTNPPT